MSIKLNNTMSGFQREIARTLDDLDYSFAILCFDDILKFLKNEVQILIKSLKIFVSGCQVEIIGNAVKKEEIRLNR